MRAEIWGIQDRGHLVPGYIADITIFDPETIDRGAEYYVQDVPGDGYRYTRDAIGVSHVLIGGAVAFEKSVGYTQARTGQIV